MLRQYENDDHLFDGQGQECLQTLSDAQWIVYKILTTNSGILSVLGSSAIVFMVLRGGAGLSKIQNRLLLSLSIFDIIGSLAWAVSTAPIPRGTNCTFGAIGNKVTCTMQGVMVTLGLCVPSYNAVLCIFYLLVIKYNTGDEIIAKYEPFMHAFAILPPLIGAVLAMSFDLFNSRVIVCWISDPNAYEINSPVDDGQNYILLNVLSMLPLVMGIIVICIIIYCMISIYRFVSEREKKMNTYRFARPDRPQSNLSNIVTDTKKQAFLYVGSFVLSYTFTAIMLILEIFDVPAPFPLSLFQAIFCPLQGFWNFFAYVRPRFNIVSRQHEGKGIIHRLYITVFIRPAENQRLSIFFGGRSILRSMARRRSQAETAIEDNAHSSLKRQRRHSCPNMSF